MKKCFFLLFFIALLTVPALADYQVDNIAVTADVAQNGQARVSTTVTLTFDAPVTQVSIPLPETQVRRVSAGDYRFSLENTDQGPNVVLRRKDGFHGAMTFLIQYTVPYADSQADAGDSFTLGLLSSRWAKPIGGCTFQVTMPAAFDVQPEIQSGYYGVLSTTEAGLTLTDTGLSGSVSDRMAWDSLSLSMALPEGYFQLRRAALPKVSFRLTAAIMAAIWLVCGLYWRGRLWFPRAAASPRLLMPEGIGTCQLPMVLDGYTCDIPAMILEWANLGYVSLSCSRQGTALLTRRMDMGSERSAAEQRLFAGIFGGKYRVAVTPGRFSRAAARFRAESRRALYRVIFDPAGGNPALVQIPCRLLLAVGVGYMTAALLPEGAGFVVLGVLAGVAGFGYSIYLHDAAQRFWARRIFDRRGALCLGILLALTVLALIAGALPEMLVGAGACLFSGCATAVGPRRAQRGIDALAQAQGCRTFYRRVSWQRLQSFQGESSRFFETQLPRALALNAGREFSRRFERLPVPMPLWLEVELKGPRSAESIYRALKPILRQLQDAFR